MLTNKTTLNFDQLGSDYVELLDSVAFQADVMEPVRAFSNLHVHTMQNLSDALKGKRQMQEIDAAAKPFTQPFQYSLDGNLGNETFVSYVCTAYLDTRRHINYPCGTRRQKGSWLAEHELKVIANNNDLFIHLHESRLYPMRWKFPKGNGELIAKSGSVTLIDLDDIEDWYTMQVMVGLSTLNITNLSQPVRSANVRPRNQSGNFRNIGGKYYRYSQAML